MKKEELRKMIKELMQEVLGETETSDASEETLDERSTQSQANKAKKREFQRQVGSADLSADARRDQGNVSQYNAQAAQSMTPGSAQAAAAQAGTRAQQAGAAAADSAASVRRGRYLGSRGVPQARTASIATSPSLGVKLSQQARGTAQGPSAAQAGSAAEKAAQAGLKKIPGTFGLYSKTGAPPAEFRSSKGQLVPVKSASGKLTENNSKTSTRLVDLIAENSPERRVNLIKVQALMEKIYPELTAAQSKKLMEMCKELHEIATHMNHTRYIRTESSLVEWKLIVAAAQTKVQELKEEVEKLSKKQKEINFVPLVKALDEVFVN